MAGVAEHPQPQLVGAVQGLWVQVLGRFGGSGGHHLDKGGVGIVLLQAGAQVFALCARRELPQMQPDGQHDALAVVAVGGQEQRPLLQADEVAVLPDGHPLAVHAVLQPADFEGQAFVSLAPSDPYRQTVDQLFEAQGVARRKVVDAASAVSVCALVRQGLGLAISRELARAMLAQLELRPKVRSGIMASLLGLLPNEFLPAPTTILLTGINLAWSGELWTNLAASAARAAVGFLIGGLPKNFDASFRAPGPRKLAVASGGGAARRRRP